jgi:RNA polymerase subunit RPABC4/transcription elongation factor Spt4
MRDLVREADMPDLLQLFREKAEELVNAIDRQGGVRSMIEGLRRQMAAADRRRTISRVKSELRRLDRQITEMVTAVGVQAVGLHEAGKLTSPELQPLCQHILELKAALAQQEAELAMLEATVTGGATTGQRLCPTCNRSLPNEASFCPYCGTRISAHETLSLCTHCGAELRSHSRFCPRCGQEV